MKFYENINWVLKKSGWEFERSEGRRLVEVAGWQFIHSMCRFI